MDVDQSMMVRMMGALVATAAAAHCTGRSALSGCANRIFSKLFLIRVAGCAHPSLLLPSHSGWRCRLVPDTDARTARRRGGGPGRTARVARAVPRAGGGAAKERGGGGGGTRNHGGEEGRRCQWGKGNSTVGERGTRVRASRVHSAPCDSDRMTDQWGPIPWFGFSLFLCSCRRRAASLLTC